jgi:hypothetical protein
LEVTSGSVLDVDAEDAVNLGTVIFTSGTLNADLVNHGRCWCKRCRPQRHLTTSATSIARGGAGTEASTVAGGFTNNGLIELTHAGVGGGERPATLAVTTGTLVNAPDASINVLNGIGGGLRFLNAALDNRGTLTLVDTGLTSRSPRPPTSTAARSTSAAAT